MSRSARRFDLEQRNAEWMRTLPAWPEGIADKDDLLRWLDAHGMTVQQFKQMPAYTARVNEWIGADPATGEGGWLRFPWLRDL